MAGKMRINRHEYENHVRFKEVGGKTLEYKCKICGNHYTKYKSFYAHFQNKHTKPPKPPRYQNCPYCFKRIKVPKTGTKMHCPNPDCIEEIKIIDGYLKIW